jgi:DNA-binding transcriptional regulator YhcF (GntR family)
MKIRLDRTLPIALTEQIKGQIVYGVATGQLTAGERMPSVRELAALLNVAPMTIAQVYRELARQGIVVTKQGSGTFVADVAGPGLSGALEMPRGNLCQMVEGWLQQAMLQGYALEDVRQAFLERIGEFPSAAAPRLWMVGNFRPATEAYAREIEGILTSLHAGVRPVLLSELRSDLTAFAEELPHVKLVITVPTRLAEVRALLEPYGCCVAAVAFRVSSETRQCLASVGPEERVGILATYGEFLPTMVEDVGLYCPPGVPPRCAILGQEEHVAALLADADVVIYASGSEAILERLPAGVRAIELRHVPEPDSVNRLRLLVA